MDLDQVLSERQELNERIATQLAETGKKWGIVFGRVEIREVTTNDDTARAMRQQMEAERGRRAQIAEAEGRASAEVLVAEADRQAMVLRAQGQAEALRLLADAEAAYLEQLSKRISPEGATQLMIAQKMLQGFEVISKQPASQVYLPSSFQGLLALPLPAQKN
jgi:regulator of protease activity HflC (stomatin/prohibitin superfamily)